MEIIWIGIIFVITIMVVFLAPIIAVRSRDREIRKKNEEAEKNRVLTLSEFLRELTNLYKEEFALGDGGSYFVDPKTMDKVKEIAKNREKINKLKARFPEYEGQYDDSKLYEKARYSYGDDVRMMDN